MLNLKKKLLNLAGRSSLKNVFKTGFQNFPRRHYVTADPKLLLVEKESDYTTKFMVSRDHFCAECKLSSSFLLEVINSKNGQHSDEKGGLISLTKTASFFAAIKTRACFLDLSVCTISIFRTT